MTHRCLPLLACAVLPAALLAAGCASVAPPAGLAGEHSAHVTADVARGAQPATQSAVIPVEHIFELSNPGPDPVVIVSHRTRINTVWHFEDTGTGALPRTIAPGETLRVAVTAKVRGPETQRFYVELHLSTGDVERLDLVVDG